MYLCCSLLVVECTSLLFVYSETEWVACNDENTFVQNMLNWNWNECWNEVFSINVCTCEHWNYKSLHFNIYFLMEWTMDIPWPNNYKNDFQTLCLLVQTVFRWYWMFFTFHSNRCRISKLQKIKITHTHTYIRSASLYHVFFVQTYIIRRTLNNSIQFNF